MTIAEAENQYFVEVENLRKQHELQTKKALKIWDIVCAVLIAVGIILIIIGYTTPPVLDALGEEMISFGAYMERGIGIFLICFWTIWLLIFNLVFCSILKKGPRSFLEQNKNLYFNYLKCVDMDDSDKKFYKEKLEEIRHIELINAIHSSAAVTSAAILFSTMAK